MTKRIEWTTAKGTPVSLTLETSEIVNGHERSVYRLVLTAGDRYSWDPQVVTHPTAGTCLKPNDGWLAPVADSVSDDVAALIDEHRTEVERRRSEADRIDSEYHDGLNRVRRAMAE